MEWLLILTMATLGAVAFAILFKAGPVESVDLEGEKMRQDLAKLSKKEEQKKKVEKKEQKEKKQKAAKQAAMPTRVAQVQPKSKIPEEDVDDEPQQKQIYVPMVSTSNATPTTRKAARSVSPVKNTEEKKAAKEVNMPTKRQIQRDLSQGFVVVSKKGPPPLTPEQKKERELMRQKEEEEKARQEAETLAKEKERERKKAESSIATEVSLDDVRAKLNKHKQEKQEKEAERKKINCVVKSYTKVPVEVDFDDGEEDGETRVAERKTWGAVTMPEGDEVAGHEVDAEDYPMLQTAE